MATKVRPKLSTPQAEAMGVEAAREYERERKKEVAQAEIEAERELEKQDYVAPLLEAGLSKAKADAAWEAHVIRQQERAGEALRAAQRTRVRSKL